MQQDTAGKCVQSHIAEGAYEGAIEPDHDNGGTCMLMLTGGRFNLKMVRYAPYFIEDGQHLSGTYCQTGEEIAFSSEEFYSYTWETVKQEQRERTAMHFRGRFGPPKDPNDPVKPLIITLRMRKVWPLELVMWPSQQV